MKNILKIAATFLLLAEMGQAQIDSQAFTNPPKASRPVPLWFWNNTTVNQDSLVSEFQRFTTKDGYGGCAILPFGQNFKPEYLSENYFSLYEKIIKEAGKAGLQMSLYDEYGFPSGSIGAINADGIPRLMNKYPNATVKRLDKIEYPVTSGSNFRQTVPATGKLMAAVAMDTLTRQRISLTPFIKAGQINWNVPSGSWKVLFFVCVKDGDPNVDYLDPEAVKLFVKETHEEYYKRFPESFGTVITTTFFDEPTMYRAQGRMWTDQFNEKFKAQYKFSPELFYPALWYDIGEDTQSARNYLFGFRSVLYSEGFMKTIGEWAARHGIHSTGHQDQEEVINPVSVSGDLMLCGKFMDIPGIDKIGGDRPAELYYKVVSSSANNWDKQWVMSETYGAMGNISVKTMYEIAMDQYTKGINMLIPHAVWYNDKDVTFLPELSYRNELYRDDLPAFNQFLSRLNYLLRKEGRHVADIAMIYPIESLQGDHFLDGPEGYYNGGVKIPDADYIAVSSLLTDTLGKDFTYLHPEVLNLKCKVKGPVLCLDNPINKEKFRVLIVPGMKTISLANLRKIEAFHKAGGHVLFTTQLPVLSVEFGKSEQVKEIISRMLSSRSGAKGMAQFIPQPTSQSLRKALAESPFIFDVDFTEGNELRYIHKVCDNQSIYYFANLKDLSYGAEVQLRGHIIPQLMNPHTGKTSTPEYRHESLKGEKVTVVKLSLNPHSSVFVVESSDREASVR